MAQKEERIAFILNANVIIDYVDADESVLPLAAKRLGGIGLPSPLLREVDQISQNDFARLRLTLVEPTFRQSAEASKGAGTLSFEDRLCLITARDIDAICVTNDKRLRTACEEAGVSLLWGLELMHKLVRAKGLTLTSAIKIATMIGANNPLHITPKILERFERRLRSSFGRRKARR